MSAILFGSISTIADTSELQRQAFNQAFEAHGLDWHWDREAYVAMLEKSGGQERIAEYAGSLGQTVDAAAVHRSKSEFFQKSLKESQVSPRSGVVEIIEHAKRNGLKLALVTTTSQSNVALLLEALRPDVQAADFDLVLDAAQVERSKPDPAAYTYALEKLGEQPENCIAIEDNLGGRGVSDRAGLDCVAFPNQNTAAHNFEKAQHQVDRLEFEQLHAFLLGS